MKTCLVFSFLFLLFVTPAFAKNSDNSSQQTGQANSVTTTQTRTQTQVQTQTQTITPTGSQVQNKNQVQTQNSGEEQQLSVQTQESEQLNQDLSDNFQKVSDQVKELINTVGAKTGIGQQVKDIAQNQEKIQDQIKLNLSQLASQSATSRFFIGSDKKAVKQMEQQMEQNRLLIQQLEELKTQTKNSSDLTQIQQTIDLMTYQNTSLQEKISQENKVNGLFGWLVNLFNR